MHQDLRVEPHQLALFLGLSNSQIGAVIKDGEMRLLASVLGIMLFGSCAQAKTIEECCQHAAAQHGYTGDAAACYASVCQQFVSMEPDGRKCAAHGRGFTAYRAALQQTCGISH